MIPEKWQETMHWVKIWCFWHHHIDNTWRLLPPPPSVQLMCNQNSTLLRLAFFSPILFFISLLFSFVFLLNPFLIFLTFGLAQLFLKISSNFFNASFLFWAWVLYSWDVTVIIPSLLILFDSLDLSLWRTSCGIHLAESRWKRSSTLVLTLFTFWPPAPEERENDIWSWSSGIWMNSGTVQSSLAELENCRVELLLLNRDLVFLGGGGALYGRYVHVFSKSCCFVWSTLSPLLCWCSVQIEGVKGFFPHCEISEYFLEFWYVERYSGAKNDRDNNGGSDDTNWKDRTPLRQVMCTADINMIALDALELDFDGVRAGIVGANCWKH